MNLSDFFQENSKIALAFSGGVDSAYLLYAAKAYGADTTAYYVKTAFQPQFEYEDACRLADELGMPMKTIELNVLADVEVSSNLKNRCYYCKRKIFTAILSAAKDDGYTVVMDGTNASDDVNDRPGMKALTELSVRSPLRECGLTKEMIRSLSKEAGLFTWDKPAYACLATRISTGTEITEDLLLRTEMSENYLRTLGFTDFRIRLMNDAARLQLKESQFDLLFKRRCEIYDTLHRYYSAVLLDLEVRDE